MKNSVETLNLINLCESLNLSILSFITREINEDNLEIKNDEKQELIKSIAKNKLNKFKELKNAKKYQEYLRLRVYETQRLLMVYYFELLLSLRGDNEDKWNEVRTFIASLDPHLKRLIKPRIVFKKVLKTLNKDKYKKFIEFIKVRELAKLLVNNN